MILKNVVTSILVIACTSICLALSVGGSDKSARDFIEHVLRIPSTDKVLNTVIGRLERNRHIGFTVRERISEEINCEEPSEILPEYTESLQPTRERGMRQLGALKHYPICHLERRIRRLNTNEFEYRPAYYEEIWCTSSAVEDSGASNEICSTLGFSCVQWNKTIHLTRRRYTGECWESRTMVIPAGCECMWPVHKLGDIDLHL